MPNLHVVSNQAVTIALTTTEQIIATMTPFDERYSQGGPDFGQGGQSTVGAQGVYLGGSINVAVTGAAGTATVRIYRGLVISGPNQVGISQVTNWGAVGTIALDIGELDTTLIQLPAQYIVTIQLSAGTGTVNRVIFTAEGATAFE